ncbi:MAG: acyl-CoA dehydrogenase family protein [Xanthobacteraceae bacterium]
MNLTLTEIQTMLQDTALRLVREKYGFEKRKNILREPKGYSEAVWMEFAELGLLGIEIEEKFGGAGGTFRDVAVVMEAFGRGLVVEPYLSTVIMGAGLVAATGNEEQKRTILPAVSGGTATLSLAHGEPKSRYHLDHVETIAKRDRSDFVIDGQKAVVLGGDTADWLIVSARTAGDETDHRGISLFLVTRDAPGVTAKSYVTIDDRRAAEISLSNVKVRASALLGAEGEGFALVEAAYDRAAAATCSDAVGAMAALNELTNEYLKTRVQFGKPIGTNQVLQHRMVDMVIAEEQARSITLLAVNGIDRPDNAGSRKAVLAAKAMVGKCAQKVGRDAIQQHGGIGLTMEYVGGHYFRRLTAMEAMFGNIDHHLERFAIS